MATVVIEANVPENIPELVDAPWCARVFGISTTAVNTAVRDGAVPATKIGHSWAIRAEDAMNMWMRRLPSRRVTIIN